MSVFAANRVIGRLVADRLTKLQRYRKIEFRMRVKNDVVFLDENLDTQLGGFPGKYSLRFYESGRWPWRNRFINRDKLGHAVIGLTHSAAGGQIARALEGPIVGKTARAFGGWVSGWLGTEPEHFAKNITRIQLETRDGWILPSWLQRQNCGTWVIHVHGRGATPAETARNFELFAGLGFSNLSISYRQDHEAHESAAETAWPKGQKLHRLSLGTDEWLDLEAAVEFATSQGATKIIVFGWSYGAAISLEFSRRSEAAHLVAAYIFDSPVISWRATLQRQLELASLPTKWADFAAKVLRDEKLAKKLGLKGAVDFAETETSALAKRITKPILILHSKDDGYIPFEPCEELAEANHWVKLVRFEQARHCKLYNYDQARYAGAISEFLGSL